jgi:hypothetical protein
MRLFPKNTAYFRTAMPKILKNSVYCRRKSAHEGAHSENYRNSPSELISILYFPQSSEEINSPFSVIRKISDIYGIILMTLIACSEKLRHLPIVIR